MSTLAFSPLLSFGTTTTLRQIDGVFQLNALEYSILESRCWCPEQSNLGYVCVCDLCQCNRGFRSTCHKYNREQHIHRVWRAFVVPPFSCFCDNLRCWPFLHCLSLQTRSKVHGRFMHSFGVCFFSLVRAPITENSRTQQAANVAQNITRSSTSSSEQCRRTTDESTWESTSL